MPASIARSPSSVTVPPTERSFWSFWKYFCACVRVCTTVRVFTIAATFFHSLPYSLSA